MLEELKSILLIVGLLLAGSLILSKPSLVRGLDRIGDLIFLLVLFAVIMVGCIACGV